MSLKFSMQADTLGTLGKKTSSSHEDLGALVKDLFSAADDLHGKFNGAGKAAFNDFKAHTDDIATELNAALASVLQGVQGQDRAFQQGDDQMADDMRSAQSRANFSSARFSA